MNTTTTSQSGEAAPSNRTTYYRKPSDEKVKRAAALEALKEKREATKAAREAAATASAAAAAAAAANRDAARVTKRVATPRPTARQTGTPAPKSKLWKALHKKSGTQKRRTELVGELTELHSMADGSKERPTHTTEPLSVRDWANIGPRSGSHVNPYARR